MTADIKAKQLFQLLENLIQVLDEETALLEKPSSAELKPILQKKQQLLAEYESYLQELGRTPHFFQLLSEDLKNNLRTMSERFQVAAQRNERRLEIANRSSQMIADRIKKEAQKASGSTVKSYGQSGGYNQKGETRTVPVAINQTL